MRTNMYFYQLFYMVRYNSHSVCCLTPIFAHIYVDNTTTPVIRKINSGIVIQEGTNT